MPELPEVQCYVDSLHALYLGKGVREIRFYRDDIRYKLDKRVLRTIFASGQKLLSIERVGKLICIQTGRGRVWVSLGMSGSFSPSSLESPKRHEHLALVFDSGEVLGFIDPRRFGFWKTSPPESIRSAIDPLDSSQLQHLFLDSRHATAKRPVKALLLDQAVIGGVGNIYALEALFRARISPTRACQDVSRKQWRALAMALPAVLQAAIRAGGSSVATYRRLHGAEGTFQMLHDVYDRHGQQCRRQGCLGIICRVVQSGRGSWFCPKCQL